MAELWSMWMSWLTPRDLVDLGTMALGMMAIAVFVWLY